MSSEGGAVRYTPPAWFWALSLLLAFVAYAPALDNDFIADDYNWVYQGGITWNNPANVFSLVIANFFRPVVHVWFAVCRLLFDLNPLPYYAAAIAIHGLNGGVVAWAIGAIVRDRLAGRIAGLVFVLHFAHFDAVYWLSAISDLLGTTATTLALACAALSVRGEHRYAVAALALTPIVLLCKESMVMIVPLLALTIMCFAQSREAVQRASRWWVAALGIWIGYLALQRGFQAASPHVTSGYWGLGWHPPRMLLNAVANFVVPNRFVVPSHWLPVALGVAVGLFFVVSATQRAYRGQWRITAFFLGWIFLAFFPCAFFQNYDRIPSRYGYLPSVAFAGIVGWLLAAVPYGEMNRPRRGLTLAIAVLVAVLNILYVWRIDAVRYERHSAVSRAFVTAIQRDSKDITTDTTIVTTETPLPFLDHHSATAVQLYLGHFPKAMITTEPGDANPSMPDGSVVWYKYDPVHKLMKRQHRS